MPCQGLPGSLAIFWAALGLGPWETPLPPESAVHEDPQGGGGEQMHVLFQKLRWGLSTEK